MKFYFSVISHNHQELVKSLGTLERLASFSDVDVILRDNIEASGMRPYCSENKIHYIANDCAYGFAKNNNLNYLHALSLGMKEEDYFVLLNPDVDMTYSMIVSLLKCLKEERPTIAAPNLFLNKKETLFDDNLRLYPNFISFVKNYLFNSRNTVVNKAEPDNMPENYWASGAFIVVKSDLYRALDGFDETYFMYCEDVDFCLRANRIGKRIHFMPDVHAVHYRRRHSQKFLSKLFFQHVKSVFLYHFASRRFRKSKSCLQGLEQTMKKL